MTESPELRAEVLTSLYTMLAETEPEPQAQIERILDILGAARTIELAATARKQHAAGMTTIDGTRKRTRGGVFFKLAKDVLSARQKNKVWPHRMAQWKKQPQK